METISINIVSGRIIECLKDYFVRASSKEPKKGHLHFLIEYFVSFFFAYFTVTDFARFRGLSGFNPFSNAV